MKQFLKSFVRQQQGSVLIITGLSFLVLLAVGGAAIDLGRQQLVRAKLQQASDAAAVAAATLSDDATNGERSAAASRYFALNFPDGYLGVSRPVPAVSVSASSISVIANAPLNTRFIGFVGVDQITSSGITRINRDTVTTSSKYDLVFVMDASGSMEARDVGNVGILNPDAGAPCIPYNPVNFNPAGACPTNGNTRMNAMRSAAVTVTTNLLQPNTSDSRIGAVTWSDAVVRQQPLSGDFQTVRTFLGRMVSYAGTNSTSGLQAARTMSAGFRDDAVKSVVLLTDGVNGAWNNGVIGQYPIITEATINPQSLAICTQLKQAGVVVYTIAFGTDVISNAAARNFLRSCATSPANYFSAPNAAQLNTAFAAILTSIQNMRIVD